MLRLQEALRDGADTFFMRRGRRQFNVMALTYGTESHEIDKAYLREQDELIKANMEETKALLDHRYNQEEKFQKRMEDTLER